MKVLLIGKNSYLASGISRLFINFESVVYLSHNEFLSYKKTLLEFDLIINFAIDPECSVKDLNIEESIDLIIARQISNTNCKYVFISSRKVYGSNKDLLVYQETDPITYFDYYSYYKFQLEKHLSEVLRENKLMILRVGNIIGDLDIRTKLKTYVGWIANTFLKNGYIEINQSPLAIKDFITKNFFQEAVHALICRGKFGVYNISSNISCPIGFVLTKCVGKDNLKFSGDIWDVQDQFLLDNTKLYKDTGLKLDFRLLLKEFEY